MPSMMHDNCGTYERANVMMFVFNAAGEVLAGQLCEKSRGDRVHRSSSRGQSAPQSVWQTAQGGVNYAEPPPQAAKRELHEEFGLQAGDVHFLCYYRKPLFIPYVGTPHPNYDGARVIVSAWLMADGAQWDLETRHNGQEPEFSAVQWVLPEMLVSLVAPNKTALYRDAVQGMQPLIQALQTTYLEPREIASAEVAEQVRQSVVRADSLLTSRVPFYPGKLVPQAPQHRTRSTWRNFRPS